MDKLDNNVVLNMEELSLEALDLIIKEHKKKLECHILLNKTKKGESSNKENVGVCDDIRELYVNNNTSYRESVRGRSKHDNKDVRESAKLSLIDSFNRTPGLNLQPSTVL